MNIQEYSVALLKVRGSQKTTKSVAQEIGVSQSTGSRFLKSVSITSNDFIPLIKAVFGDKQLTCVVDDSTISKRYSKEIEGTSSMLDQSTKTFTTGYCMLFVGLTDGTFFLPIDLEQWVDKAIMQETYQTKTEVAEKLILKILAMNVRINQCVFDGLYFSESFLNFLDKQNVNFVIKAKTTTSVLLENQKIQLRNCKKLVKLP